MTNMQNNLTFRTHGAILCVAGDLKFTLSTAMVTITENETRIMVNRRYFPKRGTVRDVGGMISDNRRKKTPRDSMMEMDRETFSPLSEGR